MKQDKAKQHSSTKPGQVDVEKKQQSASPTPEEQQQELEEIEEAGYLELLRRTQADFVNYKRRIRQEKEAERQVAQSDLIAELLPPLDDLGRALRAAPPELANHPWVQGILLVDKRLGAVLEQIGVHQIGAPGENFDPRWHDAVTTEIRPDVAPGTIVDVIQPGYALGERVIRPTRVVVAKTP